MIASSTYEYRVKLPWTFASRMNKLWKFSFFFVMFDVIIFLLAKDNSNDSFNIRLTFSTVGIEMFMYEAAPEL